MWRTWLVVLALCPTLSLALPGITRVRYASPHFQFLVATQDTAELPELANLAEQAWDSLSKITGYKPPTPVRIVIRDEDDYANGWAIPFQDWISIWLTPLDFEFRGGTRWRANVLSHELSHVFTMRALGFTSHYLGHDVGFDGAYGSGEVVADAGLYQGNLESWLAEGLAQYGAERCGFDRWDSHRDMLERIAWKSGAIQDYPLLVSFSGDARESELLYNQGYSFIRFVMSHGKSSLETMLADGKAYNIRKAVEHSLGKSFAEAFAAWRNHLQVRHGAPNLPPASATPWLENPHGLAYLRTAAPIIVGKDRYFLSSHRNDYGITSLYRQEPDGSLQELAERVEGRLSYDASQQRILFLSMSTGADRRDIRDVWSLNVNPQSDDYLRTQQLSERARIVDASAGPEGVWVIARSQGKNQLGLLRDGRVEFVAEPPAGSEYISVATTEQNGELIIGTMDNQGYHLLRYHVASHSESPLFAQQTMRDPVMVKGVLYATAEIQGRWQIVRAIDDKHWDVLTAEEGGAFQPSVSDQGLAYSAYGANGFHVQNIPLQPVPAPSQVVPDSIPDIAAVVDSVVSDTQKGAAKNVSSALGVNVQKAFGSGNPMSMFGFATQSMFMQSRPAAGDSFALGDKILLGGALYWMDPTMENQFVVQVLGLKGAGTKWGQAGWDPWLAASWQCESWAPQLSATANMRTFTLEAGHPLVDSVDTLQPPAFTLIDLSLEAQWPVSNHWYVVGQAMRNRVGYDFPDAGLTFIYSEEVQMLGGLVYYNQQPGRYGSLSGVTASLAGGSVQFSQYDLYTGGMDVVSGVAVLPSLELNTHLLRVLLLNGSLSGQWIKVDTITQTSYAGALHVGIPLGRWSASLPVFGRHLTWKDPLLRLGASFQNQESEDTTSSSTSGLHVSPGRWSASRFRTEQASSSIVDNAPWATQRDWSFAMTAELDITTLTLGQSTAGWSVGVSVPFATLRKHGAPAWYVSLAF